MSSTVLLPTRVSLVATLVLIASAIGDVFAAAYNRADDIEPFGL